MGRTGCSDDECSRLEHISRVNYLAPVSYECSSSVRKVSCGSLNRGRKVMEWFTQKTSIAGIQIPTWLLALSAIIVLMIIYTGF